LIAGAAGGRLNLHVISETVVLDDRELTVPPAFFDTPEHLLDSVRNVLGPDEAIDTYTAIELYTAAGTRLTGASGRRGRLKSEQLAGFVADEADPFTCELNELAAPEPVLAVVGGGGSSDPQGRTR
jgi:hypothetical protein